MVGASLLERMGALLLNRHAEFISASIGPLWQGFARGEMDPETSSG
jgi:hypothetical protein